MYLKVRKGEDNSWGFVESFQVYRYLDKGSITVTVCISPEGKITKPYVFRGNMFVPADVINEEIGIEKYLKAKKPFYCMLADGFVATIKAGYNFTTGELIKEGTSFDVYTPSSTIEVEANSGTLQMKRLLEIPVEITDLLYNVAESQIVSCKGVRKDFLLSRL